MAIIESVPNISEGRNRKILGNIRDYLESVENCTVLHMDSDPDANRTVFTLLGHHLGVLAALKRLFIATQEHIDLRHHEGRHPRLGALDVVPVVPLDPRDRGLCVELAHRFGAWVGEHGVPVFFYEDASPIKSRAALPAVRRDGYQGLARRLASGSDRPHQGPQAWSETVARSGATVIGVRNPLVAWNVDIQPRDLELANRIAKAVRQRGPYVRDAQGHPVRDRLGRRRRHRGLSGVRAIAWDLPSRGCTQVSMNLVRLERSSMERVWTHLGSVANAFGAYVPSSELIGLVPGHQLLEAGVAAGANREDIDRCMAAGVARLGLDVHDPFNWQERVLEEAAARAGFTISL